jgi:class 3 adenylate cyclase
MLPGHLEFKQYENHIRFPAELEQQYRLDTNLRLTRISRPGTVLAILVYLSFWLLDIFALPQNFLPIWLIRFVGIFIMAGLLLFTYSTYYPRFVTQVFLAASLVVNLSVIATILFTLPGEVVFNLYFITLFFVILGAPLLGLPFRYEIIVCLATLVAFLAMESWLLDLADSPSLTVMVVNVFFLFGASAIGIFGAYLVELSNRTDFLLRISIQQEQALTESLLLNILPASVATRLKRGESVADYFQSASVMFADIVNFTPLSARLTPSKLIELLNQVFSYFDSLVEKYNLEKIKTIGDCYMVTAGVPEPRLDHAHVLASMALEIQQYVLENRFMEEFQITFRIGIHSGPLVAGVIGRKKFIYDLWGDTVNTASRMESHGFEGGIQISRATYELIKDEFFCQSKGMIQVKGKGEMEVWQVLGFKKIE